MNVYARHVDSLEDESPIDPDARIQVATPDEAELWFEETGASGDWAEPDGLAFMLIRCTLKPETRLFLAWRNGRPVGGGALEIHSGVAALMAAETLPAFRSQGIHTALLRARLVAAHKAGCDLAMVHTRPGAASQRNVLRAGFQLVYTVDTMVPSN
jgi:GNAT superfamily N-acetyltransferase